MITVHIFSDRRHRYGFTLLRDGSNLPTEGYGVWNYLETKTYALNDKKFPLLPFNSNQLTNDINVLGYKIVDVALLDQ